MSPTLNETMESPSSVTQIFPGQFCDGDELFENITVNTAGVSHRSSSQDESTNFYGIFKDPTLFFEQFLIQDRTPIPMLCQNDSTIED